MKKTPFELRSGNATPFKMMGSSPVKQGDPLDLGLVDEAKKFDKAYQAGKATTPAKPPTGLGYGGTGGPHVQDIAPEKPTPSDFEARWKADKRANLKSKVTKVAKKAGKVAGKILSKVSVPLTVGEFFYDVGKRGIQRKKEGKSGFNPTKGQKTTTAKNKGFNF
tara:strand:+ start:290 stop:781 length:492 start_codon:yes stop_codon:yes gene_type:complete